ncbi:MAG: WavE lipopolysaccharide synthesis family protein [Candidatus Gastranaerophilales bacterium]|nr:WavE lipopolysaccharide synthesis family protein [Candidatus Gastranaerophilales bacterium]
MLEKIKADQISVVIQGPIVDDPIIEDRKKLTYRCIKNVRKFLPEAEIILSTWKGSKLDGLEYDIVVENNDPGTYYRNDFFKVLNNVNRQIVSTKNGVLKSNRKYVLKLRSDVILESANFLKYFAKYKKKSNKFCFVKERVLACTFFSRNPRWLRPYPYHPSDLIFFGLKEDLVNIWDIPLAKEPETSRWFEINPRPIPDYYPPDLARYCPEQYIWLCFLRKYRGIDCEHQWDISGNNIELTELTFANNLVLLEPEKWKMNFVKYDKIRLVDWVSIYSHNEWLALYKKYCDKKFFLFINFEYWIKRFLLLTGIVRGADIKTLQARKQHNDLSEQFKKMEKDIIELTSQLNKIKETAEK